MKHYTESIPVELAKKLKEAGMPEDCGCNLCCYLPYDVEEKYTYGFVFDWLMERGINIMLDKDGGLWSRFIEAELQFLRTEDYPSWHEASNAAIEKAVEIITKES